MEHRFSLALPGRGLLVIGGETGGHQVRQVAMVCMFGKLGTLDNVWDGSGHLGCGGSWACCSITSLGSVVLLGVVRCFNPLHSLLIVFLIFCLLFNERFNLTSNEIQRHT